VLLFVFNLLVAAALGFIAWALKRLVSQSDQRFAVVDARLDKVIDSLTAEREARHSDRKDLDDRVWGLAGEVKQDFSPRRETMRQYGTLVQAIQANHEQVLAKIDALPCRAMLACPTQPKVNT
jgi:hypothetical protein